MCLKAEFFKTTLILLLSCFYISIFAQTGNGLISGKIISTEKEVVDFATVYLKGTNYGGKVNEEGIYHITAPNGTYTLVASAMGYNTVEEQVTISGDRMKLNIRMSPKVQELKEVAVVSNGVTRINRSAFNALAIDTKSLENSTQTLSQALAKAPGIKLRESGGVGSDTQLMMDGFNGRHIKIFIDGVPQEGVGSSFGLNNIPVNYAERIEVYRGVVPVGFGTDAIGGVINIVTKQKMKQKWFLDASYSYGSFNTHKSYVHFGQSLDNGLVYEINAFQNYSDNNYSVNTAVKDFETGVIDRSEIEKVKRFHDKYHNEAISAKIGLTNKKWADRLMFGFIYSNMYKDIQTGVKQEVVFGGKHRKGYTLMPSVEYSKLNIFNALDVVITGNYNRNITNNIDTASYEYNWRGDKRPLKAPGEQSYQYTRSYNDNWNGTFSANYRLSDEHLFTFNHVINSFQRSNQSMLNGGSKESIKKETRKNISGLSYRFMPVDQWNMLVFGKYYDQFIAGPIATSSAQDKYVRTTNHINQFGYGAATTYFFRSLQAKLSYEKAFRLPSNEEMFGDEDLETGDIKIKPERSDNLNLSVSFSQVFDKHSLFIEGGVIYRDTKDFIQRRIVDLSGGKSGAAYENHGKVLTKGYNISVRYGFANWISVGGSFSQMDVKDNVKTISGESNQENLSYKSRMPNIPYRFANSNVTFYWHKLGRKSNLLTVTYDNLYSHSFPLYSEALGSENKFLIPSQFSHNISVSYAIQEGRYNLSFECLNFTNEKMYDNFSLQKPGRSFYGKLRVYFGG